MERDLLKTLKGITVLARSHGFSVEVEGPITFQEAAAGFGQSVVQLLVGAPLQMGDVNETGKVYKCDPGSGQCQKILIQSRGTRCSGLAQGVWVSGLLGSISRTVKSSRLESGGDERQG
uniref:Uncharacterized protein n=1 Tax=Gopherus agassizii TaxID=38772 RepID=A0A452H082_9SAUR